MNAGKLKDFVERVTLGGTIPTFVLRPVEDGTRVLVKDISNTTMVNGYLPGLKITERMAIKDARAFMDAIDFVGGTLTIQKVENKLYLSTNIDGKIRSREIGLCSEEYAKDTYIDEVPEAFKKFTGSVKIELKDLTDMSKVATKLEASGISITVKDKRVTFLVSSDTDNAKIESDLDYYDCSGLYGAPLIEVINVMSEKKIDLYLHQENPVYPVKLVEKNIDMTVEYVIAPRTKEEKENGAGK